jgi:hypothetical protein
MISQNPMSVDVFFFKTDSRYMQAEIGAGSGVQSDTCAAKATMFKDKVAHRPMNPRVAGLTGE